MLNTVPFAMLTGILSVGSNLPVLPRRKKYGNALAAVNSSYQRDMERTHIFSTSRIM